ncbi:MAG TPA: DUF2249 domain-containing protein [Opitutaceae bacterium]|nr:DUF2249 domain-containing protein [Opitutaceae bacterium]
MTIAPTESSPTVTTVVLDVRGLPPPEPMQHVLEALAGLPAGATLLVHIHREPMLLYQMIEADGWSHSSRQLGTNRWEIGIWRLEEGDEA